jgi:hypothetical protein
VANRFKALHDKVALSFEVAMDQRKGKTNRPNLKLL